MKAIQELTAALTEKQIRFEHYENDRLIGFTFEKHVWHWFEYFTLPNGKFCFHFKQSYSQNTGRTKKSFRHGFKMQRSLEKRIGKQIED